MCSVIAALVSSTACAEKPSSSQQTTKTSGAQSTNRLAKEASPYLRQHAHNPVDWYPWGQEALERAKREQKPIFLSIGYAACHWCHVMERESFMDAGVAKLLNDHFVCIKVDREERPDIDDLYMNAVIATTGRGGWPMSVFLTPEGRPFFGGTYFPRDQFKELITRVDEVWRTRRAEAEDDAKSIIAAVDRQYRQAAMAGTIPTEKDVVELVETLHESYDPKFGGFGRAPKFPPHQSLELLLYRADRKKDKSALAMSLGTLDKMARGGIYDHLGGGFHRYSTDAEWKLPHFEKMLYDNALLASAYTEAYRQTGRPAYKRIAQETLDWMLRDMRGPEGAFYSSWDADSEGEEGSYYLWTPAKLKSILGDADAALFSEVYGVNQAGNFDEQATGKKTGRSLLYLRTPIEEIARRKKLSDLPQRLAVMRAKLLSVRTKRPRPHVDEKRITAWNALAISSLAKASVVLKQPKYLLAAQKAASFIMGNLRKDDRLLRHWIAQPANAGATSKGQATGAAFLEDYAFLINALLDLYAAKAANPRDAQHFADTMVQQFSSPEGYFYDTADDHEKLVVRPRSIYDQATPSGSAVAIRALIRLGKLYNGARYKDRAYVALKSFAGAASRNPRSSQTYLMAATEWRESTTKSK
jgi:uncharacterized protein YyaL (SSP411 family)